MRIFNSRRTEHKAPSGAVTSGTTVKFYIRTQSSIAWFFLQRDGETGTQRFPMHPAADGFELQYTFAHEGLYFYRFELDDAVAVVCGEFGEGVKSWECHSTAWFQQTVYAADYLPAKGFAGSTMYQIFPDRFNVGSNGVQKGGSPERVYHTDLHDEPIWRPNEQGEITNTDFFGGNLRGVEEKLDYLADLGVSCIYFNPICAARSNHRYDTADYRKIDPVLGTEDDLRSLCAAAHERGIRIVLDGVFSHTGADSVYFNKYGAFSSCGAFQSEESPYFGWYKFCEWPNEYASWWGFDTLPEVNEEDGSFAEYICGEGGVIDHWLGCGADGFRLDVADELPDSFIEKIRTAVKRNGEDKLLIGEVWEDASNKISYGVRRRFVWGRELDSVMNYPFRTAIMDYMRTADARLFMRRVTEICENYPKPMLDQNMNMLSTHDTARALNALLYGEVYRNWPREKQAESRLTESEYLRAVELLKMGCALQFTLPGVPCIYYGDEIGMQGFGDPFCRGFMRWDEVDGNLFEAVKEISAFRTENRDVLADGELIPLCFENGVAAYLRKSESGCVLAAVNRSENNAQLTLPSGETVELAPWKHLLKRL